LSPDFQLESNQSSRAYTCPRIRTDHIITRL
jgi:hypothetical protein